MIRSLSRDPQFVTWSTVCHVIRSLSRDPLDYVRLTINITLDYGISARGENGTLWFSQNHVAMAARGRICGQHFFIALWNKLQASLKRKYFIKIFLFHKDLEDRKMYSHFILDFCRFTLAKIQWSEWGWTPPPYHFSRVCMTISWGLTKFLSFKHSSRLKCEFWTEQCYWRYSSNHIKRNNETLNCLNMREAHVKCHCLESHSLHSAAHNTLYTQCWLKHTHSAG